MTSPGGRGREVQKRPKNGDILLSFAVTREGGSLRFKLIDNSHMLKRSCHIVESLQIIAPIKCFSGCPLRHLNYDWLVFFTLVKTR